jgi:hypothetical protein
MLRVSYTVPTALYCAVPSSSRRHRIVWCPTDPVRHNPHLSTLPPYHVLHSPGTPCQHKLVGAHITPTATNMSIASIEIAPDESCGSTRMRRSQVRAGRRVSERPEGLRGRAGVLVGGAAMAVEMLVCLGRVVVMVVVVMVDGKVMTSFLDSVLRREKSTC